MATLIPAIYVQTEETGFPWWVDGLLTLLAVAIAMGLLGGVSWVLDRRRRSDRDERVAVPVAPGGSIAGRTAARLAGEWGAQRFGAATVLRRPDALRSELARRGTAMAGRLALDDSLRQPLDGATAALPANTLLLLDDSGALRLFEVTTRWLRFRLGEELKSWPADAARVTILPGRGNFRAVEIDDGAARLLLAAQWRGRNLREALKAVAAATALGLPSRT
jgi:hypothetical protein